MAVIFISLLLFDYRLKLDLERKFVEEEQLPYFSPLDISVLKTKDLVKQMNSAILRVLVSQYPHLFSLQVKLIFICQDV